MKNLLILVAALALALAACTSSRPSVPVADGHSVQLCTEAMPRESGQCGQP
jgi:hypothetical protein